MDIANTERISGRRHQLHQADCADTAAGALVEPRLLIALRQQQKRVETVFSGITLEDAECGAKALHVRLLRGRMQLFDFQEVDLGPI